MGSGRCRVSAVDSLNRLGATPLSFLLLRCNAIALEVQGTVAHSLLTAVLEKLTRHVFQVATLVSLRTVLIKWLSPPTYSWLKLSKQGPNSKSQGGLGSQEWTIGVGTTQLKMSKNGGTSSSLSSQKSCAACYAKPPSQQINSLRTEPDNSFHGACRSKPRQAG